MPCDAKTPWLEPAVRTRIRARALHMVGIVDLRLRSGARAVQCVDRARGRIWAEWGLVRRRTRATRPRPVRHDPRGRSHRRDQLLGRRRCAAIPTGVVSSLLPPGAPHASDAGGSIRSHVRSGSAWVGSSGASGRAPCDDPRDAHRVFREHAPAHSVLRVLGIGRHGEAVLRRPTTELTFFLDASGPKSRACRRLWGGIGRWT